MSGEAQITMGCLHVPRLGGDVAMVTDAVKRLL